MSLAIDFERVRKYDPYLERFLKKALGDGLTLEISSLMPEGSYCLAGGAFRSYAEGKESPNDLDIYVLNDDVWANLMRRIAVYEVKHGLCDAVVGEVDDWAAKPSAKKGISGTFNYPYRRIDYAMPKGTPQVQFLRLRYLPDYARLRADKQLPKRKEVTDEMLVTATTVDEVISSFDFTCCMAGIQFEKFDVNNPSTHPINSGTLYKEPRLEGGRLLYHPQFLPSVMTKTLRMIKPTNIEKSGVSYRRLYKYVHDYGYQIKSKEEFAEMERQKFSSTMAGLTPDDETYS